MWKSLITIISRTVSYWIGHEYLVDSKPNTEKFSCVCMRYKTLESEMFLHRNAQHSILNFIVFVFCMLTIIAYICCAYCTPNALNGYPRRNRRKKHTYYLNTHTHVYKLGFARCDVGSPLYYVYTYSLINLMWKVIFMFSPIGTFQIRLIQLPWTFQLWKNFRLEIIYTSGNFVRQNSAMIIYIVRNNNNNKKLVCLCVRS